ncbi:MAG: glutamyl-tRNA reductase [Fusobacteria bacterium]|nr:MAG: glutamyl-tRNA reductase [Fusobacteriota bacterium]KAF0230182.1 MAG: glutamyl-tRNA [Fusobacteriota bacterium]
MQFYCIGINYHTANTATREKVAFQDLKKIDISNSFVEEGVSEVVILSTCNRSEIYFYGEDISKDKVMNFFKKSLAVSDLDKNLYFKEGEEAVTYLFNVTAGFDSLVIGEDQILGQVKEAQLLAMSIGSSKKMLNKIFREAIATAKKIKTQLKISENPLSIGYIAIKYLQEVAGTLDGKSVLVIGSGNMGKLAFTYLMESGVKEIYATYRNNSSYCELAIRFPEIKFIEFKDRYSYIDKVDIIISCTSSPHLVIDRIETAKEMHIMDLAIPRDIDSRVGEMDNINLYNNDDLKKIADKNYNIRKKLLVEGQEIICTDVKGLMVWINNLYMEPAIKSLKRVSDNVREETLEYLVSKLDLKHKDKLIVDKILSASLNRIVKVPISRLNEMENSKKKKEYAKMIDDLFTLEAEED